MSRSEGARPCDFSLCENSVGESRDRHLRMISTGCQEREQERACHTLMNVLEEAHSQLRSINKYYTENRKRPTFLFSQFMHVSNCPARNVKLVNEADWRKLEP